VHSGDPDVSLKLPSPHASHDVLALAPANRPAAHRSHCSMPAKENCPGAHSNAHVGVMAPRRPPDELPALHSIQDVLPDVLAKKPSWQSVQLSGPVSAPSPTMLNCPAGHVLHTVAPP
jgi:hypothetical protein